MKRPPDVPDEVHRRVNVCAAQNEMNLDKTYETLLETLLDDDGHINDSAVEELKEALPAEETSAFD